jgi:hypothetical protein
VPLEFLRGIVLRVSHVVSQRVAIRPDLIPQGCELSARLLAFAFQRQLLGGSDAGQHGIYRRILATHVNAR